MSHHPYYNPDFIITLLERKGLLDSKDARRVKSLSVLPGSKGSDIVQWIAGLRLEQNGKPGETIGEAHILELIAKVKGWAFERLDPLKLDTDVVTKTLPLHFCKRRVCVPIRRDGSGLTFAVYDPLQKDLKFDISRACMMDVVFVVAPREDIKKIIEEFFEFRNSIKRAEDLLKGPPGIDISNLEQLVRITGPQAASKEQHINAAVDYLLRYALDERASDIHMEPKRDYAKVRLRIDGVLHSIHKLPKVVHEAMVTRIKALSRLDVAEKRRPQDGRMKIGWKDKEAEVRVSSVPVAFGEKIVLRIQTPEILMKDLGELGMSERDLVSYKTFLKKKYGIILITGPTGSGKSTTLYSTLRYLDDPGINIVTIEDPIEMICEAFNQIAVQPTVGITFSSILRNILRQDPDVIMIGEIRDQETARYAVQAALTGHLVFSTLHTNDAVGAVSRLGDLGLEHYLIASTVIGVVAQRLVRTICSFCKVDETVNGKMLHPLGIRPGNEAVRLWRSKGCSRCRNTGFIGRIGIYEVLSITDDIKEFIHGNAPEAEIRGLARRHGMTSLAFDAAQKVLRGVTTIDEALSVTGLNINPRA